jgi:hypothetical protein
MKAGCYVIWLDATKLSKLHADRALCYSTVAQPQRLRLEPQHRPLIPWIGQPHLMKINARLFRIAFWNYETRYCRGQYLMGVPLARGIIVYFAPVPIKHAKIPGPI